MNLIEQHNVLKGLTDERLQQEIAQPSGQTPPFLVLTEINRRKQMRERYEGDRARKGMQPTTVVEDVVAGIGAAPGMAPATAAPLMPAVGIDAAMPAFADGGLVDYSGIGERYQQSLDAMDARRDRARALALIGAGAGIAAGKSSNFLRNIGAGILPAVQQYGTAMDVVEDDEQAILRNLIDLQRVQGQEAFQAAEFDWRKSQADRENEVALARLKDEKEPAGIRTTRAFMEMTPEEQATHLRLNPPYNPNAVTSDDRLGDDFAIAVRNALDLVPEPTFVEPGKEAEAAQDRLRKAQIIAYQTIKATRGSIAAEKFRVQAGLSEGDVVSAAAGGAPVNTRDPLGINL